MGAAFDGGVDCVLNGGVVLRNPKGAERVVILRLGLWFGWLVGEVGGRGRGRGRTRSGLRVGPSTTSS